MRWRRLLLSGGRRCLPGISDVLKILLGSKARPPRAAGLTANGCEENKCGRDAADCVRGDGPVSACVCVTDISWRKRSGVANTLLPVRAQTC